LNLQRGESSCPRHCSERWYREKWQLAVTVPPCLSPFMGLFYGCICMHHLRCARDRRSAERVTHEPGSNPSLLPVLFPRHVPPCRRQTGSRRSDSTRRVCQPACHTECVPAPRSHSGTPAPTGWLSAVAVRRRSVPVPPPATFASWQWQLGCLVAAPSTATLPQHSLFCKATAGIAGSCGAHRLQPRRAGTQ